MIETEKKHLLCKRLLAIMVGGCILAYLGTFAIINFRGFARYCDYDMYADTLVAKLIWEQKTLFPENWIFSNQYYVVATPVLAALFYGVTGNTNTAMVLATSVMGILILVSLFWVLRAVTKDLLMQLICCLVLVASVIAPDGPVSKNGQLFFIMASYYSCYLITAFVVYGDYVRAFQSDKPRIGTWILCLFLSFATGIQSLRQTVVMVLPILAYECFLVLRRVIQRQRPWSRENIRSLIRAVSYAIANLIGVMIVSSLDISHHSFYGSMQLVPPSQMASRLPPAWAAIRQITRLDYAFNPEYSAWITTFCIFLIAIFALAAVLLLKRIHKMESPLETCWLLSFIGVIGVILSTIVLNIEIRDIYIFMWYPLAAFSILIVLKKTSFAPKCIAILLTCILSLGTLYNTYFPYAGIALWKGPTDTELMCSWAMDEGYEYVYGNWLVAPRVAAHSGGQIEAAYWLDDYYTPLTYLIKTDTYGEEKNSEAFYVFASFDKDECLRLASERGVTLTKVAEFGEYTAYTSPVPLMDKKH